MRRYLVAVLSAAIIVAALELAGCWHGRSGPSPSSAAPSVKSAALNSAAAPQTTAVPPPEALTDVLNRLADPAVPGIDKLNLVEGLTADDAPTLDKFTTALLAGGYAPMTFDARDIAWSDRDPADVVATVNVTTSNPGVAGFSFPMEFKPYQRGWQRSQRTADMLLAFGNSRVGTSPTPTP